MADEGYNGWKNYPTWALALWIDNEEGWQNHVRERVAELRDDAEDKEEDYWTEEEYVKYHLAEELKDDLEENAFEVEGGVPTGVYSDLLGYAIGVIDFDEVAEHYMEEE